MSIYLVRLAEFYAVTDPMWETAYSCVKASRCHACDRKVRWKGAVSNHALPHCGGEVWCSWKCLKSGRCAPTDKRRARRFARKFFREYGFDLALLRPREGRPLKVEDIEASMKTSLYDGDST